MSNGFEDLATCIDYLDANRSKIDGLCAEIDEIHAGFTTEFSESREAWETDLAAAVHLAAERHDSLDAGLREALDERLPEVRQRKAQELQEARDRLTQLEGERDAIEQDSSETTQALKSANPRLDEYEEQLKATLEQQRATLAETDAQIAEAAGGLGWLFSFSAIRRLRDERRKHALAVRDTRSRLNEVRRQWREMETEATEAEERRQEAWRLRTTEIAKTARDIEELEDDFDGACLRAALEEHIRETGTDTAETGTDTFSASQENAVCPPFRPTGDSEVDALLTRGLQQRDEQRDYEQGIVAVSELLGLLGGVSEGMKRFAESVAGVKSEQDMHADLAHLRFGPPPYVTEFDQLWDGLWPTVENEKSAIAHPARLAEILRGVIGSQLTDERIQAYFETLGATLTEATDQWH